MSNPDPRAEFQDAAFDCIERIKESQKVADEAVEKLRALLSGEPA